MITFGSLKFEEHIVDPIVPCARCAPPSFCERRVELPLARWFIDRNLSKNLVEVGAVSPYYWVITHPVLDAEDPVKEAIHVDARYIFDFIGKCVLSISTIEHVGVASFELFLKIMKDSTECLVTIPIGFDEKLDSQIREVCSSFSYIVYHKDSNSGQWCEQDNLTREKYVGTYDSPLQYANDISVFYKGFNINEL